MAGARRSPTYSSDPTISKRDFASVLDDRIVTIFRSLPLKLSSVGGTANAITASLTPALTAYTAGMILLLPPAVVNTGAAVINVDSVGDRDIRDAWNEDLIGGELDPSALIPLYDDGRRFRLHPFVTMFRRDLLALDVLRVIDPNFNAAFEVWPNGLVSFYPHAMYGLGSRIQRAHDHGFADDAGNVAVAVDGFGRLDAAVATCSQVGGVDMLALLRAQVPTPTFDAEIYHFPGSGQSLILGSKGEQIESGQAEFGALMPVGGLRALSDSVPDAWDSWVGLEERLGADNKGETPMSGLCATFREMLSVENRMARSDQTIRCLASVSGIGATKIADLDKPSTNYTNLLADVQGGKDLADAAGLSIKVPSFPWAQGEKDVEDGTSAATYKTLLTGLASNFSTDAKAITGQSDDIPLLMYQVASHKHYAVTDPVIARAQQEVFESSTAVVMVCPAYIFDYSDGVHLADGREYRRLGAYYGWMAKRLEIDGIATSAMKPMVPTSHTRSGSYVDVTFRTRYGGLRLDFESVRDNTFDDVAHGFELFAANGTTPIEITRIRIFPGSSTLRIYAGSTIPANAILQYAHKGEGETGRIVGPRGNLRDEQGESQIFNGYAIHNFAPIFRRTLT